MIMLSEIPLELIEEEVPANVVDRMLAHAAPGHNTSAVLPTYDLAQLLKKRRSAIELWARMVCPEYAG